MNIEKLQYLSLSLYISTVVNSTLCEHKNEIEINENASKIQMLINLIVCLLKEKQHFAFQMCCEKNKMKLKIDFIYKITKVNK